MSRASVELARRRAGHRRVALLVTAVAVALAAALPPPSLGAQVAVTVVLVLAFGLPHGALDGVVATRGLAGRRGPSAAAFTAGYLGLMALAIALWIAAPSVGLTAFLLLSAVHFGRGDRELAESSRARAALEVAVRGGLPIVLPVWLHTEEVAPVFGWLLGVEDDAAYEILASLSAIVGPAWLLAAGAWLVATAVAGRPRGRRSLEVLAELPVLALAFWVLPPLLAFAMYFTAWHSARHLIALDAVLVRRDGADRGPLVRRAAPALFVSLALFAAAYALVASRSLDAAAATRVLFVGLFALTVPHVVVTAWVERATAARAEA